MLSIKNGMQLTPLQRSFIIGSMLGDATMRVGRGAKMPTLKLIIVWNKKSMCFGNTKS